MSTIWALLEQRAAAHPDALFAVDERSAALTFAEARERAVLAAGAVASDHGIGHDAVVSWQLPNWLDSVVLILALCRLQAVQNPIVPTFRQREVGFITAQAGTRLLVVPDGTATPKACAVLSATAAPSPPPVGSRPCSSTNRTTPSAGSSTPQAPPPIPRAPATPTPRSSPPPGAWSKRSASPTTTGSPRCCRSLTSAA